MKPIKRTRTSELEKPAPRPAGMQTITLSLYQEIQRAIRSMTPVR